MVKQMMDSVKYRHESGKNILTLEKRADSGR
jgi:anti-sigma regulatory factor (Ser/Thr protein kinase)